MNEWLLTFDRCPDTEYRPSGRRDVVYKRSLHQRNASRGYTTSRQPGSTGIYDNSVRWHEAMPGIPSIPKHFKQNGYHVAGGGKIYHHMPGFNRLSDWDEYFAQAFDGHYQTQLHSGLDVSDFHFPPGFPLNNLPSVKALKKPPKNPREFDWGPLDKADLETGDGKMVKWAINFLENRPVNHFSRCWNLSTAFRFTHLRNISNGMSKKTLKPPIADDYIFPQLD